MLNSAQLTEDQEKLERELTPTRRRPSGAMEKVTLILTLLKSAQGFSGGELPASTIRLIGLHYKWAIFEAILKMKEDSQHDWLYHALLLGRDNQPAYDIGRIFYVQRGMFACNIQRGTLFWAGEKIARPLIKAREFLIRKQEVASIFCDDLASLVVSFLHKFENAHTFETHEEITPPSLMRIWDGSLYNSFCASLGMSSFSSYSGATGLICLGFLSKSWDYRWFVEAYIIGVAVFCFMFGLCFLPGSIKKHEEIELPSASPVGSSSELMHLRVALALSAISVIAVIVSGFPDLPVLAGPAAGILLGVFSAYWHHSGLKLFKQRLNPLPMLLVKEEGGSNLRC